MTVMPPEIAAETPTTHVPDIDPAKLAGNGDGDTAALSPGVPPIVYHIIASTYIANARSNPEQTARLANSVKRAAECGGDVNRAATDMMEAFPETAKIAREYGLSNTGDCNVQFSVAGGILIGLAVGFAIGVVVGAAVSN